MMLRIFVVGKICFENGILGSGNGVLPVAVN